MFFDGEGVTDEAPKLPDGTYEGYVVSTETYYKEDKVTLRVKLQVLDSGPYKNWITNDFIVVEGGTDAARDVGRRRLKQLCQAVGKFPLIEHTDLVGATVFFTLKSRGDYQNVAGYKEVSSKVSMPVAAKREAVTFADDDIPF